MGTSRALVVQRGALELAGTLWRPSQPAVATLLMHPGSGPSTRDNDVYFPEIRQHLLRAGIAVASFDKRGVGGSTGRWQHAGILDQAHDAIASLHVLADEYAPAPYGLFGHSQGGWVVLEAAVRDALAKFVITNSGPGVTPAAQEHFSVANTARRSGSSTDEVEQHVRALQIISDQLRAGSSFETARERLRTEGLEASLDMIGFVSGDPDEWALARTILDHDPVPAMRALEVPLLTLFGGDDEVVPVQASVDAFRANVDPELLTVAVLPDGDHRLQTGEPPRLVPGYAEALVTFILAQT
jgi:uncharacterized protein